MSLRNLGITAALLLTGALATSGAHAGPNVQWQVSVETPVIRLGHVSLPLPPILVPRAVVVGPQYDDRGYRSDPRQWDADRDGIPNRRDPVYNPRWDRDGDGVPNRYDARPNDPRYSRHWHGHDGWRGDDRRDNRRDDHRDDRRDDRRDWRDEGHRR